MNNVKYNNWKDAVREHSPAGLDKEAAWLKLQQRDQPSRKRKRWLPWLAAACFCGIAVSLFFTGTNNKTKLAGKKDMVQPANNTATIKNAATEQNNISVSEETGIQKQLPLANIKQHTGINKQEAPAPPSATVLTRVPDLVVEEDKPVIAEYTPPVIASVQPAESKQSKPALKIVHLNELNQQPSMMVQQTPPEERTAPKFPFTKPGYAKARYEAGQEPPPVQQRKGFGLPRSLASLKD